MTLRGRGAQSNPGNRFDALVRDQAIDSLYCEEDSLMKNQIIDIYPKTIVNKVASPDVGMAYSINPYQGCEHGCTYCYARNTHNYWGYSAGLEFEQKILVKRAAPQLLKKYLENPKWDGTPIALSGNTDCYQPIERKLKITREILKVFLEFKHPTAVISKSALILRDLDLLAPLTESNLFKAAISLNTLNEDLRQKLEPRASSVKSRIKTIKELSKAGIPTKVMIAPIIPGLNSHEIPQIVEQAAEWGASSVGYILVRLNGDVATVFSDWLTQAYPDRFEKVLNQIAACHGGKMSDSRFHTRMRGEGAIAEVLKQQFSLFSSKYFGEDQERKLDSSLYLSTRNRQLSLF